ncbi:hypothetical protein [Amycolatopsis jiangsuensis]|uniref:Uncharacterized protein n=1 Tax=Amycolatopsis jiangsuensis TaxID=1181879 RepID=A0A840J346_9PSEU|nr:hypothetical protein [Amycolatopsis jiangsuensis]MBB4688139.1 hypothetical protein [Amycolatopsis jiangsuensis]
MSENEEQPAKKSWWGEGHKWIAAVAALITAVAGIFIGRSSAPQAQPATPATVTPPPATVTVTAAAPSSAAITPSSTSPVNADPGVYSSEDIEWGRYNLDFKKPIYLAEKYIAPFYLDLVAYGEAAKLAEWQTDSLPGKDECASAVAERGDSRTGELVKGNIVCGKTAEGRIFRIEVLGVSGNTVTSKVLVWNK